MLSKIANLAREAALGVSALLTWALVLTLAGATVTTFDETIVQKHVALILDNWTLFIWAIASASSLPIERRKSLLAAPATLVLTFFLGPRYLAITAIATTILSIAMAGFKKTIDSLLAGIVLIETVRITAFLLGIFNVCVPRGLEALDAVHYSLYAPFTWVLPLLVYIACLAPLVRLALHLKGWKPSATNLKELQPPSYTLLLAGIITGVGIWLLIYRSPLNPGSRLVGVDAQYYFSLAQRLERENLISVLRDVSCDRPLYVLILQRLTCLLGPRTAVEALPLLCTILNSLAAYTFAKTLKGDKLGGLAALLAPLTYTTTTGIYAGYYANWLALALSKLASAAYIISLTKNGWSFPLLTALITVSTVTMHAHMGVVLIMTLILTSLIEALSGLKWRPVILGFLAAALAALTVVLVDYTLNLAGGQCRVIDVVSHVASGWSFNREVTPMSSEWWKILGFALRNWMLTAAYDPTDWVFTAAAALLLPLPEGLTLLSWFSVSSILVLIGPGSILIHRALYSLPLAVTVAIGLAQTMKRVSRRLIFAAVAFKASYVFSYVISIL